MDKWFIGSITISEIVGYTPVHARLERRKIEELKESILDDGQCGMPILTWGEQLITGSHRLAALRELYYDNEIDGDIFVGEDIGDLIENGEICKEDVDSSCLRKFLSGTWLEDYKDELEEW